MTDLYWGDVLQSYSNGVQLDLRVRLAVDFLKSPGMFGPVSHAQVSHLAVSALDLATELLAEAERRGLVKPMPEDDGISAPARKHIARAVRSQVLSQIEGQRIGAEESPKVMGSNGGFPLRQ